MSRITLSKCDVQGCGFCAPLAMAETHYIDPYGQFRQLDLCHWHQKQGYWICRSCWEVHHQRPCPKAIPQPEKVAV